jgi:hypothetical protein
MSIETDFQEYGRTVEVTSRIFENLGDMGQEF